MYWPVDLNPLLLYYSEDIVLLCAVNVFIVLRINMSIEILDEYSKQKFNSI